MCSGQKLKAISIHTFSHFLHAANHQVLLILLESEHLIPFPPASSWTSHHHLSPRLFPQPPNCSLLPLLPPAMFYSPYSSQWELELDTPCSKLPNSSPITLEEKIQISTKPYMATFSSFISYQSPATCPTTAISPIPLCANLLPLVVSQIYQVFSYLWALEPAVPSPEMVFAELTPSPHSGICSDTTFSDRPFFS